MNELIAREGFWLTQIECQDEERVFLKMVTGVHATYDYWQEWSDEQVEQWQEEHPAPEPPEFEDEA